MQSSCRIPPAWYCRLSVAGTFRPPGTRRHHRRRTDYEREEASYTCPEVNFQHPASLPLSAPRWRFAGTQGSSHIGPSPLHIDIRVFQGRAEEGWNGGQPGLTVESS
ncbi:hypothetical protein RvY_13092 [Ramazzottius varieornatus]|uniref:Uncharacterized protein n=1 Tax=Ramazzottius varieornatus TaxID=947166 RepID=A0A1D1VLR3_RAMVA|nr:hypothetical protein RvY_13092 [Ramazzottius varieornatus]